jgi:hypothetical protein
VKIEGFRQDGLTEVAAMGKDQDVADNLTRIIAREYKVMIDPTRFGDQDAATKLFWEELVDLARTESVEANGRVKDVEERRIIFLDTPDQTLRGNNLILRRRRPRGGEDEYTLKCRSEDRYVAGGTDVEARRGDKPESKFEEDIAPPFRCRFSRSNTVVFSDAVPETIGEAARIFPVIGTIQQEGRPIGKEIPLNVVHKIEAFERVHEGGKLFFKGLGPNGDDVKAKAALIIWSNGEKGRPLVAEFSFRIKSDGEQFTRELALAARSFFDVVQCHDWCLPNALTKTEYVYRDRRGD